MKLDKAIEITEDILHFVKPGDPPDEHNALKLLIEAGKLIRIFRELYPYLEPQILPGETED